MANRMHHMPAELSGGQQQRAALARALVTNPSLILADEPTGNLDSRSTEDVLRIFARLNEEGRTVVLITHEPDVAEQSKRIVRLSDGQVVEDRRVLDVSDPPAAVRRQKSAHRPPLTPPVAEVGGVIGTETLRIAWSGITANKLRSGLTILGMTIGVASVIVLIAVGNGSSKAVQSRIQSLGTNVLVVMPSGGFRGGARASTTTSVSLTKQDAEALQEPARAPDVRSASPVVNASSVKLVYGSSSYEPSSFIGTTPSYLAAHSYRIDEGASFTAADVSQHRRVAVIGQTVLQELFGGQNAVGQSIKVNGGNYEVVGVLAAKGSNGAINEDDVVMAPITTVQDSLTGTGPVDSITVQAKSESSLDAAESEVTQILEERHRIKNTAEPGFSVLNQGSLLETSSSTSSVFTTLLGEVAAISLLVGGYRRDEHHARERHRAHARDRHPQGDRRQALGHPHPVPHGGDAGVDVRRSHRRARRRRRQPVRDRRRAAGNRRLLDLPRLRRSAALGPVLRHLPGRARRRPQTDRGAAL